MVKEPKKFVGAVEASVKIMRRLAATARPEGVAVIARETGLNVSTTFNILKTLHKEGIVVFDPDAKTYSVGIGILELAAPALGRPVVELIRPLMENVAQKHGLSVACWNVTPTGRLVIADSVAPSTGVIADLRQQSRFPELVGAVGRCVAAVRGHDDATLQREFEKLRWENPPSFEQYKAEVAQAGQDGFACDHENLFHGISLAAAVIRDIQGAPRMGLSVISLSRRTTPEALRSAAIDLRDAARKVERCLFGVPAIAAQ